MTKLSVKRPFTVFVGVVLVIVLGIVAFTRMTTDLLPEMELPYMIVYTTYPGASPERVEASVTEPLEAALGTTTDLKEIQSISSENLSMIIMEFGQSTDMNAISIEVSNTIDQNKSTLPETAAAPIMMQISPDMMPVMVAAVDKDGMDIQQLSDYLDEEILSQFERLSGVASVTTTGTVTKQVQVRLSQDKIDAVNDDVLRSVSKELADAKKKIDDGQAKLDQGKAQLESAEKQLQSSSATAAGQLGQAKAEVDSATAQLNALLSQETTLQANQASFQAERAVWENYAGMNDSVHAIAMLIAIDHVNGSLPTLDFDQLQQNGLTPEMIQELFSSATDFSDAINHPAAIIQQMTEEEFEAARDEVMGLVSALIGDAAEQMGSVSKDDFVMLVTTAAKAVSRIETIDGELDNIATELATVTAMKPKLEEGLAQAKEAYAKLEASEIEGTLKLASGNSQIQITKSSLDNAQAQLDSAYDEFKEAREAAYEKADISGIVTADMISNILTAENFEMPAGYIESGSDQYVLKVGEAYGSLDELKDTLLFSMDNVGDIRLSDVANIRYRNTSDNEDAYALVNGNDAILLSFSKNSTASTSDVSKRLNKQIEALQAENEGLHITPLMDQGDYIQLIVSSVLQNLIIGALLAVLVLLLFLRDYRPTVIIAFSIPMSVLFAIVLMYFSNITLNIISLSGLALGIGMLVDNSIVVVENIYRFRNMGMPPAKAAVRGARQVAAAITASTLTTICVFLPIVFTEGLTRQLFTDMGLTIGYSLVASLIVALTVVPSMSSTLLKNTAAKKHTVFDRFVGKYQKLLRWCLGHRVLTLAVAILLLVLAAFESTRIGMEYIPDMSSSGQMAATMTMPDDATKEETVAMVEQVSSIMKGVDGVNTVGAVSGSTLSLSASNSSAIQFYLLTEKGADGNVIKKQIETQTEGLPCEMSISASAMDLSAMMSTGVQIDIYGKDLDTLQEISADIAEKLSSVEGLTDISDGNEDPDLEKLLTIDKDAAMKKGLTVAQVFSSLAADLTEEVKSTTLSVGSEDIPVVVIKPSKIKTSNLMRQTVEATDAMSGEKEDVRLDDIADLSESTSLSAINRDNNQRTIAVKAAVDDDHNVTLVSREVQAILDNYEAPNGYTVEINGENAEIMDSMKDLLLMLLLAIIFIYLIMVAQFQSLLSPFIVLFTLPLAFTGGLLALVLTRTTLSVIAMLGFVVLSGIVVNNGIVFVDYTNQMRLEGMSKREALVETGKMRIRPILMTALTTILSMSTMALGIGSGAEMSQGMAIVIIGGLLYATLLTLIIIPVMYDLLFRRQIKKIDIGEEKKDEFDD